MNKHTLGPWKAEQTFYNDGMGESWNVITVGKKNTALIASIPKGDNDKKIAKEIAANPEMKEAIEFYLKGVKHFFKCIDWGKSFLDAEAIAFMNEHELKFRNAIKKATE